MRGFRPPSPFKDESMKRSPLAQCALRSFAAEYLSRTGSSGSTPLFFLRYSTLLERCIHRRVISSLFSAPAFLVFSS